MQLPQSVKKALLVVLFFVSLAGLIWGLEPYKAYQAYQNNYDIYTAIKSENVPAVEYMAKRSNSINDPPSMFLQNPRPTYNPPILYLFKETPQNAHLMEIMQVLVENGAKPDYKGLSRDEDVFATPLSYAVEQKRPDAVWYLLAQGADSVKPSLHPAFFQSKTPGMVKIFLKNDVPVDVRDGTGRTALMAAENTDVAKTLVQAGADTNAKDEYENTPLHHAVDLGRRNVAKYLLNRGAPVDVRNSKEKTPLDLAIYNDDKKLISLLLKRGDFPSDFDQTKLVFLSRLMHYEDPDFIRLFLKSGLKTNVRIGNEKLTLLMLAAGRGNKEMVEVLFDFGADPTLQTSDGLTALDVARKGNHEEIVRILESEMESKGSK